MSGRHFTLDAWATDESGGVTAVTARKLADAAHLKKTMDELVVRVGMQILQPAEMLEVAPNPQLVEGDDDCGGVTGVVILTTSHGSVHTWPLRGQVSFDLYSCRDFDPALVLEFLTQQLGLTGGDWTSFARQFDPAAKHKFRDRTLTPQPPNTASEDALLPSRPVS